MPSAISFNLDQSTILSSGNGLTDKRLKKLNSMQLELESISLQKLQRPYLFCELFRGCYIGLRDIKAVESQEQYRWCAFTYLKVKFSFDSFSAADQYQLRNMWPIL